MKSLFFGCLTSDSPHKLNSLTSPHGSSRSSNTQTWNTRTAFGAESPTWKTGRTPTWDGTSCVGTSCPTRWPKWPPRWEVKGERLVCSLRAWSAVGFCVINEKHPVQTGPKILCQRNSSMNIFRKDASQFQWPCLKLQPCGQVFSC